MFQIFLLLCEALIFLESKETVALTNINREEKSNLDASLISLFLENILNLGLKSLRGNSAEDAPETKGRERTVRRCDKYVLKSLIKSKVKELRPMLQDSDYNEADPDDNLTLKGKDKTTIVELVSEGKGNLRKKESFKQNIKKYKRLKRVIHKALINESVSNKTIYLIIRTIDDMIAKMMSSRCSWKRNIGSEKVFRMNYDNDEKVLGIPAAWHLEWRKIKEKYSDLFKNNKSLPHKELNVVMKSLMEKLPSFFANVLKDGEILAKEYNVRCQKLSETDIINFRPLDDVAVNYFRHHNAYCKTQIWMCSGELEHFLMYIYKSIHTVTEKVLTDYLEMYKLDVNIDKIFGKKGIITRLKEVTDEVRDEVCAIYVKEIEKMNVEREKKTDSFITALLYLVDNITAKVIIHTNEVITFKMNPMDNELKERILKDIEGNMKMELDRLSEEMKRTICPAFETCNGRYTIRNSKRSHSDPNSVFVRVIVKLDDEMRDPMYKSKRSHGFVPHESNKTISKTSLRIQTPNIKLGKLNKKAISVTRTTRNYSNTSNIISVKKSGQRK